MEGGEGKQTLQSPLMPGPEKRYVETGGDGEVEGHGRGKREVMTEVKKVLWLAGPLVSTNLLQYCLNVISVISVMFVGHLGELPLSGAVMATSFAGVTGFSLLALLEDVAGRGLVPSLILGHIISWAFLQLWSLLLFSTLEERDFGWESFVAFLCKSLC